MTLSPPRARPGVIAAWAVLCAAGFALFLIPAISALGGGWDFLPIYTAAKLAGTSGVYNPAVVQHTEVALAHTTGPSLLFTRLPFVAGLAWPLTLLSYDSAHAAWMVLRLAALLGFILLWPHSPRYLTALACAWFVPLAGAIANGQDVPFLLLWIAIAERFRDRRPFLAGLALSLCLAKFHLFLLLPVFLWMHRRRVIPGFLAGCAALAALSFAVAGLGWPAAYLTVLRLPQINPGAQAMPNLHGLQLAMPAELALSAAVFVAAAFAIRRFTAGPALAVTLAGGILLSYHCYLADLTLLLPALLVLRAPSPEWRARLFRWAAMAACGLAPLMLLPAFWLRWGRLGGADFLPFYAAAKLLPGLRIYDPQAIYHVEIAALGGMRDALVFIRIPAFAALLWPLAQLPYATAHFLWFLVRALAAAGFVFAWPHNPRRATALAAAFFLPLAGALSGDQDTPLLLLSIALAERVGPRRPFAAGLLLALCAAKPHLFLLLPIFLWVHRRRLIPGFLAGGAALLALSFAVAGPRWPQAMLAVLRNPAIEPWGVFNLHSLGLPAPLEIALTGAIAVGALAAILRLSDRIALAATLTAGILLSYHTSLADTALLLPAVLLFVGRTRKPATQSRRWRLSPWTVAGALGAALMLFALTQKPAYLDDFRPFYRAAGLLGSPDLFAQTEFHAQGLMFLRTPFYAALLHPLTWLPYPAARTLWTALMAAAFVLSVRLWPGERRRIAVAMCWSVPVLMALAMGQDIALMLLIAVVSIRVWESGRPFTAGLIASLLALKVTLLLPVAIVFFARSRRASAGLVLGAAAQFALSFAVQGPAWIPQYLAAVRSPLLDQVPARMPSFAAFVTGIPFLILAAAAYVWIWRIARRESLPYAVAAALALGIVAAPHCYAYDMAAAIPLLAGAADFRSLRGLAAALALSPAPFLLMSRDHPSPAGAAILVAAVLAAAIRTPDATMTRTKGPACPSSPSWFPRLTSARTSLP